MKTASEMYQDLVKANGPALKTPSVAAKVDFNKFNFKWTQEYTSRAEALKTIIKAINVIRTTLVPDIPAMELTDLVAKTAPQLKAMSAPDLPSSVVKVMKDTIAKTNQKAEAGFKTTQKSIAIALLQDGIMGPTDLKKYKNIKDFQKKYNVVLKKTVPPLPANLIGSVSKKIYNKKKSKTSSKKSVDTSVFGGFMKNTREKSLNDWIKKLPKANLKNATAGFLFSLLKKNNENVDFTKLNYSKKSLKWSNSSITRDEAVAKIVAALNRFESNVIPNSVKNKRIISTAFLDKGMSSSVEIVDDLTPRSFGEVFKEAFEAADAVGAVKKTYNNAVEMRSRILFHYMNISDVSEKHYSVAPWSCESSVVQNGVNRLPNYEGLFGQDVYVHVDHDNSVLSPSAYLYELKKMVSKHIVQNDKTKTFDVRRGDIDNLELTSHNTSSEICKIEVVNQVCEKQLSKLYPKNIYKKIYSSVVSYRQPFMLPFIEVKEGLSLLGTTLPNVCQEFSNAATPISMDEVVLSLDTDFYKSKINASELKSVYGVAKNKQNQISVRAFMMALQISYEEVDSLIAGALTEEEAQTGASSSLFVNSDVKLAPITVVEAKNGEQLLLNVTDDRLNKIIKLLRFSNSIGMSLDELQWLMPEIAALENLSTFDQNIFSTALPYIVMIKELQVQHSLSTKNAMGLLADLSPALIDNCFAGLLGMKIDVKSSDKKNKANMYALMEVFSLSEIDFNDITICMVEKFALGDKSFVLDRRLLSSYYRVSKLMELTDRSFCEVALLWGAEGNEISGPIGCPSNNLYILRTFFENHKWAKETNISISMIEYVLYEKYAMTFGSLTAQHYRNLLTGLDNTLKKIVLTPDFVYSLSQKVIDIEKSEKWLLDNAELTSEDVYTWLIELNILSSHTIKGIVLRIPENYELISCFEAKKLRLNTATDSLNQYHVNLSKKIRNFLIFCYNKQSEAITTQIASDFNISNTFAADLAKWPNAFLKDVNLHYIVGEESSGTKKGYVFNMFNRMNVLIGAMKLNATDLEYLLTQAHFLENADLSCLKELSLLPQFRDRYKDFNRLKDFKNTHDISCLTELCQWDGKDSDLLLAEWGLNKSNYGTQCVELLTHMAATSISVSETQTVLGFESYNEIVLYPKNGGAPYLIEGPEAGCLGSSVAIHENILVATDAKNKSVTFYFYHDNTWQIIQSFVLDKAPSSVSLNNTWCAVSVGQSILIYPSTSLTQASKATAICITANNQVKRVFLDSAGGNSLGYVTDDNNYYVSIVEQGRIKSTKVSTEKSGIVGGLEGDVYLTGSTGKSLKAIITTESSNSLKQIVDIQYADTVKSSAVIDVALLNGQLTILTTEKILTVELKLNNLAQVNQKLFSFINRIDNCFNIASQTHMSIDDLLSINRLMSKNNYGDWKKSAQDLKRTIRSKYAQNDSATILKPFECAVNEAKRDALVEHLLKVYSSDIDYASIRNRQDLSEHLLIDVEVTSLVTTSFVKEAIGALQLYIHRCLMNLETGAVMDEQFDEDWPWMKNYRVWEANRKVFLYPENYLEPELRKNKTPLFDIFLAFLNRNKVSESHIDKSYYQYLDGFLSIANLSIVNVSCHDRDVETKELLMIGRTTQSDGFKYYYRIASFKQNEQLSALVPSNWSAWNEIDTKIPTKWITPIRAFGRLYVFWVEIQAYSDESEGGDSSKGKKKKKGFASLKCSYFNFRDKWSLPQTLVERIMVGASPESIEEKNEKFYHQLKASASKNKIEIVYEDPASRKMHNFFVDPHMRVTASFNKGEGIGNGVRVAFEKTNDPKGFFNLEPAYKGLSTALVFKYSNHVAAGGWIYTGNNASDLTLLDYRHGETQFIVSSSKKKQLILSYKVILGKGKLDTGYTLKAKTWYYIGINITDKTANLSKNRNNLKFGIDNLMIIEGSSENNTVTGKVSYINLGHFNLDVNFKHVSPLLFKNSKILAQTSKAIPVQIRFMPGNSKLGLKVKNLVVHTNNKVSSEMFIKISGINLAEMPEVYMKASNYSCEYVQNSAKKMILIQNEEASYLVINDDKMKKQYFHRLTSSVATHFEEVYSSNLDGISSLLSLANQNTHELSFENSVQPNPDNVPKMFWPNDDMIDLKGADGIYYWELFFFAPLLLARSYQTHGDFEAAKKWYEYVFNPFLKRSDLDSILGTEDLSDKYWNFVALKTNNNPTLCLEHMGEPAFEFVSNLSESKHLLPKWETSLSAVTCYHENPFDPHAIAALRPIAYQKYVFVQYVKNFITWGDKLYTENTRETLQEAYMMYSSVVDLLGKRPQQVADNHVPEAETLKDLSKVSHELSEFLVGIEDSLTHSGPVNCAPINCPNNDIPSSYFGVAENEAFIELWDTAEGRLYNLRHQLTLDGQPNCLPLFQPAIDPLAIIASSMSGSGGLGSSFASSQMSIPEYRYSTMYSRVSQVLSYVSRFGSQLQSALGMKDSKTLTALRFSQETELLNMMHDSKKAAITIAQAQLETAKLSLKRTEYKRDYYETLMNYGIGKKFSDTHRYRTALALKDMSMVFTEIAATCMSGSSALSFVKSILAQIANKVAGFSFGIGNIHDVPGGASHSMMGIAMSTQMRGGILNQIAGQIEQTQNYWLMKKDSQEQIESLKVSIDMAEERLKIAELSYQMYQKQVANNQQLQEFYESNFLDEELYSWMAQKLSELYRQAYDMAHELALQCQRSWQYETGDETSHFINASYWDPSRRGFLAGESLQLDMLRMDKSFYDKSEREFELVKYVSLKEIDPLAFVTLTQTGQCHFSLSERLFAADYPDHYKRRIKSVSLSLSAQGSVTNINATLTQLSNKVVMEPNLDVVSYLHTGKTRKGTDKLEDNLALKVRTDYCNHQQIATSTAKSDAGLFSVNFTYDKKYLPYEGTGAVSDWLLEMGLDENPKICTTLAQSISLNSVISTLDIKSLIEFLVKVQSIDSLKGGFHGEVVNRLANKITLDDLIYFIENVVKLKELNTWFNNMGAKNMEWLLGLVKANKKNNLENKLSAYIKAQGKKIPDSITDSGLTTGAVLNVSDVIFKVSYTSKCAGGEFKEFVKELNKKAKQ